MRDDVLSTARNEKPQAGYPCPLLLGKGSTFCHACICNDNDHAGDIVRTCRDYVIGCSRNVAAMVIPHQTSRGSASRHLQALSSQFTLFLLPPTLRTLTTLFITLHLRRLRIISPRGITTFSLRSYTMLLRKRSDNFVI